MSRIAGYVSGVTTQYTPAISGYGILTSSVTPTTITGTDGNQYSLHTFNSSGSFTITTAGLFDLFIVGGGGGGGAVSSAVGTGGGGGGGEVYELYQMYMPATAYTVTVGAGGSARNNVNSASAGDAGIGNRSRIFITATPSTAPFFYALGGGAGLSQYRTDQIYQVRIDSYAATGGGSGGYIYGAQVGGSSLIGLGSGGSGINDSNYAASGGGGGAGGNGGDYTGSGATFKGGVGGAGVNSSFSGSSVGYGGGGSGGHATTQAVSTATHGGGTGSNSSGSVATAGTANRGGGGGGCGRQNLEPASYAQNGGSGVVMVRYRIYT